MEFRRGIGFLLRSLRRKPILTLVTVSTLGLGIGAVAVISALLSTVLFPQLPYEQPERLAVLWSSQRPGATARADYLTATRADAWVAEPPRSVERIAAAGSTTALLRLDDASHRINATAIGGHFFEILGARMAHGRALTSQDSAGVTHGVVLSDRAWRRYFRGDPGIVGQSIGLDSASYTVVGVALPELDYPRGTEVWVMRTEIPARLQPVAWLLLVRLRPGISFAEARAEFMGRSQLEHRTDSLANAGYGVTAVTLSELDRQLGSGLFPLISVCLGALFLIALLNLGILLLLEVSSRTRELAIRAVLGAGRWGAIKPFSRRLPCALPWAAYSRWLRP